MTVAGPDIAEIRALRKAIAGDILLTPVVRCAAIEEVLGNGTEVVAKLEFLQRTGTFKARGALATLRSLSAGQRAAGVTAVSAGNHAIATAFAARALGVSRKTLSAILNGKAGISPEMAVRLSIAFDTTSESWINQQAQYDLWRAEQKRKLLDVERIAL